MRRETEEHRSAILAAALGSTGGKPLQAALKRLSDFLVQQHE